MIWLSRDCPQEVVDAWRDIHAKVKGLESAHHAAPMAGLDAELWTCATEQSDPFHWLMERTTCIQKEVSLAASSCNFSGVTGLRDNAHILEEMRLLEKDMSYVREGIARLEMARRGRTPSERFMRESIERCMLDRFNRPYRFPEESS